MSEIEIDSPATIVDMADMAEAMRLTSRLQWQIVREAWRRGDSYALRAGGELIAVAGMIPIEDGCAEAWFQFRPQAADHMLGIVRAIRLTLARAEYRAIVTLCRTAEGARIARAAGFVFGAETELGEVWGYERHLGHHHWKDGAGGGGARPGAAAHKPGGADAAAG